MAKETKLDRLKRELAELSNEEKKALGIPVKKSPTIPPATIEEAIGKVKALLKKEYPEFQELTIGVLNRGVKPPPTYRNPDNPKETWTAKGGKGAKKPAWAVKANIDKPKPTTKNVAGVDVTEN